MRITDHPTSHVFRHYDICDVDALRERLARAREQMRVRPGHASVSPIRALVVMIFLHSRYTADACPMPVARVSPRRS